MSKRQSTKIELICKMCEGMFKVSASRFRTEKTKYCSMLCKKKYDDPYLRFWRATRITCDSQSCWIWQGHKNTWGYGVMRIGSKIIGAHRFSYTLHYGTEVAGMCVCHHCDTPSCVRPTHLFIGTDKDNSDDKFSKGRFKPLKGESNGMAKTTESQVLQMRSDYADGMKIRFIVDKYALPKDVVEQAVYRRTWKHI